MEVLEIVGPSLETRFSCRGLRTASGSGDVRLPEELEFLTSRAQLHIVLVKVGMHECDEWLACSARLAIPHLKKPAGTFIVFCCLPAYQDTDPIEKGGSACSF